MGATKVVDDDVGSPRTKEDGICLAKSTAGTGHDDRLPVKPHLRHFLTGGTVDMREERKDEGSATQNVITR